jgi:DNA-directed RNA polymerase subunit RPC12/RpoP
LAIKSNQPIKCPVCEFHYELLNLATNLRSSERSSESYDEKSAEIDCNCAFNVFFQPKPLFEKMDSNKMEEFRQLYSGQQNERNKVN